MKTQLTVKVNKGRQGYSVFLDTARDIVWLTTAKTRRAALTQAVAALEEAIRQIQGGYVK